MVDDKDVDTVVELMPDNAIYYLTQPDTHRAIPAEKILAIWKAAKPDTKVTCYKHLSEALDAARTDCRPDDILFIGGSNYIVGEALQLLSPKHLNT